MDTTDDINPTVMHMYERNRRAVFVDKDGTLIEDVPYNVDPELIRLNDGVSDALQALKAHHYLLIVISNQSGVARGYFQITDLKYVETRIQNLLNENQSTLDAFYYCPHFPNAAIRHYAVVCDCRKPGPGLILRAAKDFEIDLSQSWMIGDILNDVEAGNRAGCKTILIDNGNETEWMVTLLRKPTYVAKNFQDAALKILSDSE